MEMQDRTVVVTGGASGIGKATAFLLAREGAIVFVGDVDETGGRAVAAEAAGAGLTVEFLPLDLTQSATIAEFAAAVHRRAPRVGGLVNGAGWDRIQPFLENPPEMWDQLIQINLMGAIRLTRALLPPMVAAQQGKIVNISSDAGRVGSTGETVYAAAKGGLIAFTKSLARELARYHINVNCVCPGPTDTPLFQRQPERMREALTRAIPFRRIAQPQEIADAGIVVSWPCGSRADRRGRTVVGAGARQSKRRTECACEPAIRARAVHQRGVSRQAHRPGMRAAHRPAAPSKLCRLAAMRRHAQPLEQGAALRNDPLNRGEECDGQSCSRLCPEARAPGRSPARNSPGARDLCRRGDRRQQGGAARRGNRPWPGPLCSRKGCAARSDAADRPQNLLPVQRRLLVLDRRGRWRQGGKRRLGLSRAL